MSSHPCCFSPASPALEMLLLRGPVVVLSTVVGVLVSSAVVETVAKVVEDLTTILDVAMEEVTAAEPTTTIEVVVEEAIVAEPTTTTEVVVEAATKTAEDQDALAVESIVENLNNQTSDLVLRSPGAAGPAGAGSFDRCAGKEVVEDVLPGPQGGVTSFINNKEDVEGSFDLFPYFFEPSVIGSSSFRSRDRVPCPKDIPNTRHIFNDGRLQRIWWDKVDGFCK